MNVIGYTQNENTKDRLFLGDYSYGNPTIHGAKSKIIVGKFCSISDNAVFDCGFQHNSNFITTYPLNQKIEGLQSMPDLHPKTNGDITIGNDVWIADNAIIMSGVRIEDGAIIGYGAVVTKYVPAYSVVGGIPARVLKYRFHSDTIKKLLSIKWWDWSIEKIKQNANILMSNNVHQILNK